MALSVAVFVGESKNLIPKLVEKTKSLKIGSGFEDGIDCSPVAYSEVQSIYLK